MSHPDSRPLRRRPVTNGIAYIVATGVGVGYAPVAPGTVGALLGVALFWWLEPTILAGAALLLCLIGLGVWAAARVEDCLGEMDPSLIVIDEVAGQFTTLWLGATLAVVTGLGSSMSEFLFVGVGFAFFRLFDITKPSPVRQLEKLGHGVGVIADDVMAGIYAGVALHLIAWSGIL